MLEVLSNLKAWRPRPLRTGMDKEYTEFAHAVLGITSALAYGFLRVLFTDQDRPKEVQPQPARLRAVR